MEIKQKLEQRGLLVPELHKSLQILTLPTVDLITTIQEELINNPLLEEVPNKETLSDLDSSPAPLKDSSREYLTHDWDLRLSLMSKEMSLNDILLRQLGMFSNSDKDLEIGQEIINNIDENGYLKVTVDEISSSVNVTTQEVEKVLKKIQKFEPAGVGARSVSECLLIQLDLADEKDPTLIKIVESHLEDVAKKNYKLIAKAINEPLENIEPLIKKIIKLNPKPGRSFSTEQVQNIIPDVTIEQKGDDLQLIFNDSDMPELHINKTYKNMLKKDNLDPQTKEFLRKKHLAALELLRAISKRKHTLRKVIELVTEIQQDAVRNGPSQLKPLTFAEIAKRLQVHETTVCRTVMNKYIRLSWGTIALKDFFASHVYDKDGQAISSNHIKGLIKGLIENEDKKHPLSDQDISKILLNEKNLNVSRRTVTKYREELKMLSSVFRRER